jgi:hypothetical protein
MKNKKNVRRMKSAAKKAGAEGLELVKEGIRNTIKIGGDVAEVIIKDIREIGESEKKKKK